MRDSRLSTHLCHAEVYSPRSVFHSDCIVNTNLNLILINDCLALSVKVMQLRLASLNAAQRLSECAESGP